MRRVVAGCQPLLSFGHCQYPPPRQRLERQAKCGQPATIANHMGEPVAGRFAGMTYTEAWNYAGRLTHAVRNDKPVDVRVPCNGCSACCYSPRIEVNRSKEPADRLAHLDLVPDAWGDVKLRKREDGSCAHLGEDGRCTVYEYRPTVCRMYDCRVWSLMGLRRAYESKDGNIEEPAWRFDQETRNDEILHVALSHSAAQVRQIGIPNDPAQLDALIARVVPQHIERAAEAFDEYDRLTAHMTPAERAQWEAEVKAKHRPA